MNEPMPGIDFRVHKDAPPGTGLTCISIMRDERYFAPHFLALGIGLFVIYIDGSSDGTIEYLERQHDCLLVTSIHGFQDRMADGRPFHYVARTELAERFCPGQWYLMVDADEFLFLPSAWATLADAVAALDRQGEICAAAAMVDLYPETLAGRHFDPDGSPFDAREWWFDPEPPFARNPYTDAIEQEVGGVRARLLHMLAEGFPDRAAAFMPHGPSYAKLWKVPLLKAGAGLVRSDTHSVNSTPPANLQLALAHVKFYPLLDRKVKLALQTGSYWNASQEYRFLHEALLRLEDEQLVTPRSVRFAGAASLEQAGLAFARPQGHPAVPPRVEGALPVGYRRLSGAEFSGELEHVLLGARQQAIEAGFQADRTWHADLADQRFAGISLRSLREPAEELAALAAANPSGTIWTVSASAIAMPPGGRTVQLRPRGQWAALQHLRWDAGTGGQVLLHDRGDGHIAHSGDGREWVAGSAAGLMVAFPSRCDVSIMPWRGEGMRLAILFALTPSDAAR